MAAPPPPIPITIQPNPPLATTALRSFFSRLTSSLRQSLSQNRPWFELIDQTAISRPDSFSDTTSRIRKNFSYFRVNYTTILAIIISISLLTHPFSLLILLSLLCSWIFLYLFRPSDHPVVIFGRTFSDRETLVLLILSTVIVVFLTNVGSVIISALLIGLMVLCVHGAFREPEDLFLDDQEPINSGFLSFLGGAASNAAVAAAPAVPRI
ncbi:PRA1 family protein B3-like [Rutidosis leptorrhynchoides]|uniref:PRA1 family protein B3-like n=1 Tax=Rutidosis leptorrhynchoides TaxID=125765 RepID=UPI003A990BBD